MKSELLKVLPELPKVFVAQPSIRTLLPTTNGKVAPRENDVLKNNVAILVASSKVIFFILKPLELLVGIIIGVSLDKSLVFFIMVTVPSSS